MDGIRVVGSNENVTIRNGSIREWDGFGINAPDVTGGSVERIKANRNGLGGILYGDGALILLCSAFGNGYKAPPPPSYVEPTVTDSDFDGLDDLWEQQIIDFDPGDAIVTLLDVDPFGDFDGDGASNMDEFNMLTDPTVNDLP